MPATDKSKLTMVAALGAILLLTIILGYPAVLRALGRAKLAEVASNGMSIKAVMDSFAMDNDGLYPNPDSATFYGTDPVTTSNAAFQQLYASGNVAGEKLFWIQGVATCTEAMPDDITTTSGKFDPAATLQAGDNGWSYFDNLSNVDNPDLPIIVTTYHPDGWDLDPLPFNGVAIIFHIGGHGSIVNTDGSAPGGPLDVGRGTPLRPNTTAVLTTLPEDTLLLHPIPPK